MDNNEINTLVERSKEIDDKVERDVNKGERKAAFIKILINIIIFLVAFVVGRIMIYNNINNNGEAVIVLFVAIIVICFISFSGNKE